VAEPGLAGPWTPHFGELAAAELAHC
jgi:leucyl/phenylalanyl-tRNA--protein transferase